MVQVRFPLSLSRWQAVNFPLLADRSLCLWYVTRSIPECLFTYDFRHLFKSQSNLHSPDRFQSQRCSLFAIGQYWLYVITFLATSLLTSPTSYFVRESHYQTHSMSQLQWRLHAIALLWRTVPCPFWRNDLLLRYVNMTKLWAELIFRQTQMYWQSLNTGNCIKKMSIIIIVVLLIFESLRRWLLFLAGGDHWPCCNNNI